MTPDNSIRNSEILLSEGSLKTLAELGMEDANVEITVSALVTQSVADRGESFRRYLSYVVFGRVTDLARRALGDDMVHAESVRLAQQLGTFINKKIAESSNNELKGIDFSDQKMLGILRASFETIDFESLLKSVKPEDIALIRKLGTTIVPENPKTEQKVSTYILE
jgi:hypothetical protein